MIAAVAGVAATALAASGIAHYSSLRSRWWLAGLTAALVAIWALFLTTRLESLGFLVLAAAWGAATAVDLAEHRLPDSLTLIPFPLFFILQTPWAIIESSWGRLGSALIGSLVTAAILFVLAYINPSGFGLGDVKLGLTTGVALGWFGVGTALLGVAAAFILMAVISGLLLATGRIKREAEIAFGPFMILGVLVAPLTASLLGW